MATKTITITEDAYMALKSLQEPHESFTKTILRVAGKRSLCEFYGVLGKKTMDNIEKTVYERREKRNHARNQRLQLLRVIGDN